MPHDDQADFADEVFAALRRELITIRPSEVILDDAIYAIAEFSIRTGLDRLALADAREDGLKMTFFHGRAYIAGNDWRKFLKDVAKEP